VLDSAVSQYENFVDEMKTLRGQIAGLAPRKK